MGQVRAISFRQKDCGKHLSDSKKRFVWSFQIDGKNYTLQLVNSSLSGKRTVLLNMDQIHHEKNLLNIDFDFTHMIEGHSFRIYRTEDTLNKYQLRIDNRTFDQVRLGKHKSIKSNSQQFTKKGNDPFAQFQSFASQAPNQAKSNAFGDFDFQSFSKPSTLPQPIKAEQKPAVSNNDSLFDYNQSDSKAQTLPISDFQTNAFKTNSNVNVLSNFTKNFEINESNLLDDQFQFSTNAYANRNHYMELQKSQLKSDKFSANGTAPPLQENKDKNMWQNFTDYKDMAGQATKKALNSAAITFNEIKKSAKQYSDSLI